MTRVPEQIKLHPHARQRLVERGVTESEVSAAVSEGETFSAKFGRAGFRRNFAFDGFWQGRRYGTKQVETFAVREPNGWLVITVIAKYF
ncbi:MAG TPA: DUF4258 domain-containing protein [Elusimicrobiota bacterium]|nr:DUF4258 domain-containing protein [Elusimicrobiota bacterium]